jgi:aspartate racemase
MTDQKIIGLLGGMSWPSTITYYRELNRGVQKALGGSHSARILLWSGDYADVEHLQLTGQWEAAGELLADGARRLEAAGAEILGIACNTMHKVADAVRSIATAPVADMVEATAAEAGRRSVQRVAVLGTEITMSSGLYEEALERRGIQMLTPSRLDRERLNQLIYTEFCLGRFGPAAGSQLGEIANRLIADGADAIVLACTELGEAADHHPLPDVDVIDTVQVHVRALLDLSLPGGDRR